MKPARKKTNELEREEARKRHEEEQRRKLRRVLRKPDVIRATGYSGVQIDFMVADGRFPKPFKLSPGGKAVGWWEDVIIDFQIERAKEAEEQS